MTAEPFENATGFEARMFRRRKDAATLQFALVVRATFAYTAASEPLAEVPADDAVRLFERATATPWGNFPADDTLPRPGCDFVVLGSVVAPEPVTEWHATARVGGFQASIVAVGDRTWERTWTHALRPSPPAPFVAMPLDATRAFGGRAVPDQEHTRHPLNPLGRGYYATSDFAEGQPLPNLESPSERIQHWSDQPVPVCWGPVDNAQTWQAHAWLAARRARGETGAITTEEGLALERSLHAAASPPAMLLAELRGGEAVEIEGVSEQPMRFRVPALRFVARATIGASEITATPAFRGLWVLAPAQRVVVTLRADFEYTGGPEDLRRAVLARE